MRLFSVYNHPTHEPLQQDLEALMQGDFNSISPNCKTMIFDANERMLQVIVDARQEVTVIGPRSKREETKTQSQPTLIPRKSKGYVVPGQKESGKR